MSRCEERYVISGSEKVLSVSERVSSRYTHCIWSDSFNGRVRLSMPSYNHVRLTGNACPQYIVEVRWMSQWMAGWVLLGCSKFVNFPARVLTRGHVKPTRPSYVIYHSLKWKKGSLLYRRLKHFALMYQDRRHKHGGWKGWETDREKNKRRKGGWI
jgi:hypothetical protein